MLQARVKRWLSAGLVGLGLALSSVPAQALDLGIEGQVFEPSEEDLRLLLMKLLARHNWDTDIQELKDSARDYTKNLTPYMRPRAEKTQTKWKDVGVLVKEDIYLPWVDMEKGSVFDPEKVLIAKAGSYMNPIAKMPSAGIERLFVFDATDPEQLALARALMVKDIPQLSFMLVAGDLGPLAEEMNRPVYHPAPSMLEKFQIEAVPSLIGFGKGRHQGHMAVTQFKLPMALDDVKSAWFGLAYPGYTPDNEADVPPEGALVPAEGAAPKP